MVKVAETVCLRSQTQMMSTVGGQSRAVIPAMQRLWALGGVPAYYRGLVVSDLASVPSV